VQPELVRDVNRRIEQGQHRAGSGAAALVTGAVGQGVGNLNVEQPTRQVMLELVEEFVDTVQRVAELFDE
jgi:hypothetical protein